MNELQQIEPEDHRKVLTKAVIRAREIMGLSKSSLARVLGVSAASVTRMTNGDYLLGTGTKEWELASLLVRLFRGLDALMAGDEMALRSWLVHHNHALNGRPDQLITQITGLVDCVAYVDGFRAKL